MRNEELEKARKRRYNQNRPAWYKWYFKPRWKALRAAQLHMQPNCMRCGEKAQVVDHRISHKGREEFFYNADNLTSLCKRCHDSKTAREDSNFAKGGRDWALGRCDVTGDPIDPMHPWNRK